MKNKRGLEFSFSWLFSLLVGAVIIFLAIYVTTSLVGTERTIADSESAREFGILLSPVETSIESGKTTKISFTDETRVFNGCKESGSFGSQTIGVSSRSGIGKEWQDPGVPSSFFNKYLFSKGVAQGEEFFVFSKPFEFPFKVADMIFMWSDQESYCFVTPSREVEEEIESLSPENIVLVENLGECSVESTKVCFTQSGCDIDVSLNSKSVSKGGKTVYYEGDLIYGAIFSDLDLYECQVERLMGRTGELASLYATKTEFLSPKGCSSNLEGDLLILAGQTEIEESIEIKQIRVLSDNIGRRNGDLSCKLF